MAQEQGGQERTERATPHKRRQARDKGQVAKSQEINSVALLLAGGMAMFALFPYLVDNTRGLSVALLQVVGEGVGLESRLGSLMNFVVTGFFRIVAPVFLVMVVVAFAASACQVGLKATPASIEPKLNKLNPLEGFKRIFSKRSAFELAKGILKLVVVGVIAYVSFKADMSRVLGLMFFTPAEVLPQSLQMSAMFLLKALLALGIMAIADYGFQRWEFEQQIKMTVQEIKQEHKEHEGDPHLKSRMRSIQQRMAAARMMDDVKTATLVITNPTHYAVALYYDDEMSAPKVVAKGMDKIALRIRELAREHRVPIIEKPLLARMLHKECDVGQFVPATLFEAVAEVIAYVFSLRKGRR